MGGCHCPLEDVGEQIDGDEIQYERRFVANPCVICKVDQVDQRGDILVVVDVRVPLAETVQPAQVQPALDPRQGVIHVLSAGHPGIREFGVRVALSHEQLHRVEENLMVLGPVGHAILAGFVEPVFEIE